MATGIPLPGPAGDSFNKGVDTGSSMFARLMQPIIQRENMAREWKQHMDNLGIQQGNAGRAAELQPYQVQLLQAQAQQAAAKANEANMWSSLMQPDGSQGNNAGAPPVDNQPFNGNIPVPTVGDGRSFVAPMGDQRQEAMRALQQHFMATAPVPPQGAQSPQGLGGETVLSAGDPRLHGFDKIAGMKGIPQVQTHYDDNGNLISRFPSGKVTLTKVSPDAVTTTRNKEFAKSDAKIASEMTEMVPHGIDLLRTYSKLDEALQDPEWRSMQQSIAATLGTDKGREATLAMYKQVGSPKQKELIGKVQNLSRDIITKSASVFKGPFRVAEQGLLEAMKPSETDPVDVALSKLHEMQQAMKFQHFVNTRVPSLIRTKGYSPQEAFEQVIQESGASKFIGGLEQKYGSDTSNANYLSNKTFDFDKFPVAGE